MELRLYDTLTKEKRLFTPLDPNNVRMYVCGPTVYDFAHIGNARPVIVFDVLFRLLRHLYGDNHVTYVRNITDVDDKINDRAARDFPGLPLNEAIRKVTEKTAAQFHADVAALGALPPTFEPRATDFVLPRADGKVDMVTLIRQLIARGNAYQASGEVLFDTQSMPDYGALSGRKLDEQLAGARVAVDAHKKHPADFVLWKQSSKDEPGWESPWGRGRPGWHIECSAMSAAYLGDVFDIHGGGLDLIFPHHENELAQSRCAHGTSMMANYWLHNGFLEVEGEKMSKSLGNFITIRDLLLDWNGRAWSGSAIRLSMLGSHYRQPVDWTMARLADARNEIFEYARASEKYQFVHQGSYEDLWLGSAKPTADVVEALADDLNTPNAITILRDRLRNLAKGDDAGRAEFVRNVRFLGFFPYRRLFAYSTGVGFISDAKISGETTEKVGLLVAKLQAYLANDNFEMTEATKKQLVQLGFDVREITDGPLMGAFQVEQAGVSRESIEKLIQARTAARARKDFRESDRIRDELAAMGVVIKDSKEGTTWEIAR